MDGKPCRIAVFAATSGHSGVDRILKNLVPELAARGIAVDVLKVDNHGPHFESIPAGVRVLPLGTRHANTSLPALISYLRHNRPDAMLSDKDRVNRTALWAAQLARVPVRRVVRLGTTVSLNLQGKHRLERWAQTASIRLFYRYADTIIVPSRGVADDLIEYFNLPKWKVQVIRNPIVSKRLQQQAREPAAWPWKDASIPVIVGVGALVPRKDWATLIRAFALLRRQRDCRLLLIGEGPEKPALTALAEAQGVHRDIVFTGFVGNPYPLIRRSSVLALTSRWEGMGVVLAEALALGVQVVSTNCPSGPSEVLQGGKAGFLAPVGDVEAVADCLQRALIHPKPLKALQQAASRYAVVNSADAYQDALGLTSEHTHTLVSQHSH